MSIAVLTQVYDEVRRLAVAGSVVAGGDFRLKKLIAPLEQSGAKAPVFAKIAQAVSALVDGPAHTSAQSLLELTTLINAVLYTQGETGLAGELRPLEVVDLGFQTTQVGARTLKPLLEAITVNGSGRTEIIHDAIERGAFRDLRLVGPSLMALDDKYYGVAESISRSVVPLYGKPVIPLLKRDYHDPKRLMGKARRLLLLHQLDHAGSREIVVQAVEGDSKDLRIAGIGCLEDNAEDLGLLRPQLAARAKEVRHAALKALLTFHSPGAADILIQHLAQDDLEAVYYQVSQNRNPKLLKFLLHESEQEFERFIKAPDKDAANASQNRLYYLLHTLQSRNDQATQDFVAKCIARHDELARVKTPNEGTVIIATLVTILARGSASMREILAQWHTKLPSQFMHSAFIAACQSMPPAAVFESFSPYLIALSEPKPHPELVAKHKAIAEILHHDHVPHPRDDGSPLESEWDPRWLELAIKLKDIEVVKARARPGHAGANRVLTDAFEESLEKSKKLDDLEGLLKTMAVIQHSGATDSLIKVLIKLASPAAKQVRGIANYSDIIRLLPKSAGPKLEKLLPTLHDKANAALTEAVTKLTSDS